MKNLLYLLATLAILTNCKTNKQVIQEEPAEVMALPELTIQSDDEEVTVTRYQASNTRVNDLIHTKLEVKFDWEKQHLLNQPIGDVRHHQR